MGVNCFLEFVSKVMGRNDGYVIAHTPYSVLLADINNDLVCLTLLTALMPLGT